MMKTVTCALAIAVLGLYSTQSLAQSPWPAEAYTSAVKLTGVDPEFNTNNMSGACWNPVTRTLWLANNYGRFHALVENGAGSFMVATNSSGTKARWAPGGDLEAICQANYTNPFEYAFGKVHLVRGNHPLVMRYAILPGHGLPELSWCPDKKKLRWNEIPPEQFLALRDYDRSN